MCVLSDKFAGELSQSWGWDFYSFDDREPNFLKFPYDTLSIFFDGHGSFQNDHQYFLFEEESIRVDTIASKISCNNLTVIVNSCFSVNWHSEFTHDNFNSIYTNDLENKKTQSTIIYSNEDLQVETILSYNRFYISFLQFGVNYSLANSTAMSYCYSLNLTGIEP